MLLKIHNNELQSIEIIKTIEAPGGGEITSSPSPRNTPLRGDGGFPSDQKFFWGPRSSETTVSQMYIKKKLLFYFYFFRWSNNISVLTELISFFFPRTRISSIQPSLYTLFFIFYWIKRLRLILQSKCVVVQQKCLKIFFLKVMISMFFFLH